ncbi:hypothetical protein HDU84_002635 [Entophlyctis sp. JEL0112]|nr:hypothetical protein HDU84_002635 [Entophlyctis sp. JEL0112]
MASQSTPLLASTSRSSENSRTDVLDESHNRGNSTTDAIYHVICVIAGSGVLQLPFVLSQSGWIGIALISFAALANNYSGKLLVKCLYAGRDSLIGSRSNHRLTGFSHIGFVAFGNWGRFLVEGFTSAMLLGVPIVYLILSGMNLEATIGIFSMQTWIFLSGLLVLVPFVLFKTLKEIALLSAFGVFATVVVIITVVLYSVHDIPSNIGLVSHKFIDASQFASALGSISFSFSGNFVYPEVEASMAEPENFGTVLTASMLVISAMYITTATLGYAAYGNTTDSPILKNLPPGSVTAFAMLVITAHVLLAIPVLVTTFSLAIERRLDLLKIAHNDSHRESAYRVVLRVAIVAFIVTLALAVPFFKDFMALLGAVANTALIFIFPVIFDFKLFGYSNRSIREKFFGICIVFVGIFAGVVGGFEAICALTKDLNGAPES